MHFIPLQSFQGPPGSQSYTWMLANLTNRTAIRASRCNWGVSRVEFRNRAERWHREARHNVVQIWAATLLRLAILPVSENGHPRVLCSGLLPLRIEPTHRDLTKPKTNYRAGRAVPCITRGLFLYFLSMFQHNLQSPIPRSAFWLRVCGSHKAQNQSCALLTRIPLKTPFECCLHLTLLCAKPAIEPQFT